MEEAKILGSERYCGMIESLCFTVYARSEPQGSSRGFPIRRANGKIGVVITSANSKLKPFRHICAQTAVVAMSSAGCPMPFADKHVPVRVKLDCYFQKPESVSKKRLFPVVKPDIDKLLRALLDSWTGVLFSDDAQVCSVDISKHYGVPERIEATIRKAAVEPTSEQQRLL